ncbi:MAG: ABC transporter permease [Candidatus Levybacteria bacterium]|nr:ABC transporter permease [Candidatus Levybacteria bacterium]
MKLHRIYAIILRNLYSFKHSYDKMSDAFYWPLLDLLLWGLTSSYINQSSGGQTNILLLVISGIVFWLIFWRAQYEICMGLLDELWNKNMINLFITPLKFWEWVTAWLFMGVAKGAMSFLFASGVAILLYQTNVFTYGFTLIPYMLLLLLSGWWVGFLITSILMRFGSKVQTLAWSMPWVFAPFSAIYYPVSSLPQWAQNVAHFLPTSYVFEGMREVLKTGHFNTQNFLFALLLNCIYLALALITIRFSFARVLKNGITKLY